MGSIEARRIIYAYHAVTHMTDKKNYRIAVIPGDGIGKEVVPEGIRVL
jgi:isocitrate dehydrogenase